MACTSWPMWSDPALNWITSYLVVMFHAVLPCLILISCETKKRDRVVAHNKNGSWRNGGGRRGGLRYPIPGHRLWYGIGDTMIIHGLFSLVSISLVNQEKIPINLIGGVWTCHDESDLHLRCSWGPLFRQGDAPALAVSSWNLPLKYSGYGVGTGELAEKTVPERAHQIGSTASDAPTHGHAWMYTRIEGVSNRATSEGRVHLLALTPSFSAKGSWMILRELGSWATAWLDCRLRCDTHKRVHTI